MASMKPRMLLGNAIRSAMGPKACAVMGAQYSFPVRATHFPATDAELRSKPD
jgi:hypothetical protein